MSLSLSFHRPMSGQTDVHHSMPLPIVYENVPMEPTLWEYHVLTIDGREAALPDATQLNELGNKGWLLVSTVEQKTHAGSSLVHYYFVRQKMA